MYKKLSAALLMILFSACYKNQQQKPNCSAQVCTMEFAIIGIHFADKQGQPVQVQNFQVIDLRTNLTIHPRVQDALLVRGYYIVADDSDLGDFSSEGDDVQVSATDPVTNQTKTAVVKISGGCTCHISKVSGPDQVVFD